MWWAMGLARPYADAADWVHYNLREVNAEADAVAAAAVTGALKSILLQNKSLSFAV